MNSSDEASSSESPSPVKKAQPQPSQAQVEGEGEPSYRLDMWNQINFVGSRIKQGGAQLAVLSTFLKSIKRSVDDFTYALQRSVAQLKKDFTRQAFAKESLCAGVLELASQAEALADAVGKQWSVSLASQIIEPLDLFHSHFNQSNSSFYSDAYAQTTELIQHKRRLLQCKDKYMKSSQQAASSDILIQKAIHDNQQGRIKLEEVKKVTDRSLQAKYRAETAAQTYRKQIEQTNAIWEKFSAGIGPSFDAMQQSEHSRLQFLKFSLEKIALLQQKSATALQDSAAGILTKIESIEPLDDIANFILDKRKSDSRSRRRAQSFENYVHQKTEEQEKIQLEMENDKNQDDQYLLVHDDKDRTSSIQLEKSQKDKLLLKEVFECLVMTPENFDESKFIEATKILTEARNRIYLAQLLASTYSGRQLQKEKDLKRLADLVCNMLNNVVLSQDYDHRPIYWVLQSFQHFYYQQKFNGSGVKVMVAQDQEEKRSPGRGAALLTFQKNGTKKRRVHLTKYLKQHGIWREPQRWESWIQAVLEQKLAEHDFYTQQKNSKRPDTGKRGGRGLIGGVASGFKKFFGGPTRRPKAPESDDEHVETGRKNIVFTVLSSFVYYLSILELDLSFSKPIILHLAQSYDLKIEKTHLLFMELESSARVRSSGLIPTAHQRARQSLAKREKERSHFGADFYEKRAYLALGLAIPYISDPSTMLNCLMLNAQSHERLRPFIYTAVLQQIELTNPGRCGLWQTVLDTKSVVVDYSALRSKIQANRQIISNVEQVINVDVQRSFNHYAQINPESLLGILQTYAFYNPQVQYCQGMNFIAGMLYLIFGSQDRAFKVLIRVIDKFELARLFNEDLPLLKVYFYQLDRLISQFLPELHCHFKDENINASYFSSPWFITLHSNILQYHPDTENLPPVLLALWDQFILHGFKVIFKFSLYLLSEMQEDLMDLRFEYILNAINDLGRTGFFRCKKRAAGLGQALRGFKVTNTLLRRLSEEYTLFQSNLS